MGALLRDCCPGPAVKVKEKEGNTGAWRLLGSQPRARVVCAWGSVPACPQPVGTCRHHIHVDIIHTVALACATCDPLVYPCPHRHHAGPHG